MSLATLFIAFCGGVFGAIFGGTIAFIMAGFLSLLGAAIVLSNGDTYFINEVVFGPFFGPQVAFIGGVAAAAWQGKLTNSNDTGRNVMASAYQGKRSSYLIGGVFGLFGYIIAFIFLLFSPPIDAVALTIVILSLFIRKFIAKESIITINNNPANWQNALMEDIKYHIPLAFFISLGIAYVTIDLNIATFGWGISAMTLIFQYSTKQPIPVTHHVTLVSAYAALATGNIWFSAIIGMASMIVGLVLDRIINYRSGSHLDMPAAVIALFSLPIFIFQLLVS
ncbi:MULTISPECIES: hypothetical protein [unclassified Enterococcus]|uniref:hypothetical protein n=1 Tax=unclassified Enterococcus TaxID=2608891 RepID=UPI001556BCE2|nr:MULTISPECIES: hypothetical protein [unclassified Enterococcus]MBS7577907.1 hypothetical protein [Enterococcus sp. MMGLQ5-2]MBS7585232.1 hypothetical protein [Enterococcus sp. MMGLQ5-1]NPD13089.1 hypothetical protein [Enterococcus sp. MMGLQ5-1]NPD37737.1 hypothetical protein [Enterococcus sp. MMGLQ5-2]